MITSPWRNHFFGTDTYMKTILGYIPRVYMNNAATPQISKVVVKKLNRFFIIIPITMSKIIYQKKFKGLMIR